MLRHIHNHIFAVKLRDVFVQSPLVLVYQTLGQLNNVGVKQQLQDSVAKQLPASGIQVDICHMKNTMAAAAGNETLTKLFNNSNILVGFKFPEYMQQQPSVQQQEATHQQHTELQQQPAASRIRAGMSPAQIVGGLLEQPMAGPHLPQPALKALVEMGIKLPSEQPLVLVGAFYKRGSTPLAYLKKWIKLDAGQVRLRAGGDGHIVGKGTTVSSSNGE